MKSTYNAIMTSLLRFDLVSAFGLVLVLVFWGCNDRGTGAGDEERPDRNEAQSSSHEKVPSRPPPTPPSPEEQRRRSEAVRRAAEELSTRGIAIEGYLMNLIEEENAYRIAFVRHTGGSLRSEITVRVQRDNFDILSVETSD